MKEGDLAFFYISNIKKPCIAGRMRIVRESYIDETQVLSHYLIYILNNFHCYLIILLFSLIQKINIMIQTRRKLILVGDKLMFVCWIVLKSLCCEKLSKNWIGQKKCLCFVKVDFPFKELNQNIGEKFLVLLVFFNFTKDQQKMLIRINININILYIYRTCKCERR